jgi:hypothetical protein
MESSTNTNELWIQKNIILRWIKDHYRKDEVEHEISGDGYVSYSYMLNKKYVIGILNLSTEVSVENFDHSDTPCLSIILGDAVHDNPESTTIQIILDDPNKTETWLNAVTTAAILEAQQAPSKEAAMKVINHFCIGKDLIPDQNRIARTRPSEEVMAMVDDMTFPCPEAQLESNMMEWRQVMAARLRHFHPNHDIPELYPSILEEPRYVRAPSLSDEPSAFKV